MRKIGFRTTIVLFGVVVALFILFGIWKNTPMLLGNTAPDIQAKTVLNQSFTLDSLRGKPVLLNFFTVWCGPCIQETPNLVDFTHKYGNKTHVVMIDRGDDASSVKQFMLRFQLPSSVTVVLDPPNEWSSPYGVTGQPETFFITSDGKITRHLLGPLTNGQMISYAKEAGR